MKKIFIAVSICLCLLGGVLFAGCNNNKIISAEVKQGTIETTVLKDQNLDTQNLVVVFTLGNKKTVEVGADKLTLGQIDTSALGKTTLTVTYKDFSFDITITVKQITSGQIVQNTLKTKILKNSTLDTSNAQAKFVLNDQTTITVPANRLSFGIIDTTTLGTKQLSVSYKGFTFNHQIEVVELAGADIASGEVKENTLATEIYEGEPLDTSNVVAVFTLNDDTKVEVTASELTFEPFDNQNAGNNVLKIVYDTFDFDVIIKVKSVADKYSVSRFESLLLTEFAQNNRAKDDKKFEFIDKNTVITVGDDNPVDFRIEATHIEGSSSIQLSKVRTVFEVKIKRFGNWIVLTDDELASFASLDTANTTIDFSDNAIGEEFQVTIYPENCDGIYLLPSQAKRTVEFKVVDGYNVYDAKHLSVLDNINTQKWSAIKTELGIQDVTVKNVVLLNSFKITDSDIPSDHFWTENRTGYSELTSKTNLTLKGSFIDENGDFALNSVYKRFIGDNDDFCFYGNGFSIDVQQLSKSVVDVEKNAVNIVKDSDDKPSYITMHTALFKFLPQLTLQSDGSYDEGEPAEFQCRPSTGKVTLDSIYFLGNGKRTDEPVYSGSIILCKSRAVNFVAQNTIYKDFFIGYFGEYGLSTTDGIKSSEFVLKNTKGYNNYNTHCYFWGVEDVKLINTTLSMCGGPVIIADHVGYGDGDKYNNYNKTTGNGGLPTHINAIGCTLESYVVGTEPWFATYNATGQVSQLKNANALFAPLDKTFTKTYTPADGGSPTPDAMNMIIVYKNCSAKGIVAGSINRGWMRIFETQEQYDKYYDQENPEKTTYGFDLGGERFGDHNEVASKPYTTAGNPIYFESSASGGYTNSAVQTNGDTTITSGKSYADGKFTNVYMPGVGTILELFDKQK